MKKLLAAVTLATLVGSPASAQSNDPGIGPGNLNAPLPLNGTPLVVGDRKADIAPWQFSGVI